MKDEKINGGVFKEGLCYVKNYDGAFVNDYRDPRDAMEPAATIDVEKIAAWPAKHAAFLVHEDKTIDVVLYYSTRYTSYLRRDVWEIWMSVCRYADEWPKGTWIDFPDRKPILADSPRPADHWMIAEMLSFDGIDIKQFSND